MPRVPQDVGIGQRTFPGWNGRHRGFFRHGAGLLETFDLLVAKIFDTALSFVSKWALMYFGAFFLDIGMQHQGKGWQGTC
jgi:hypothetical protein